MHTRRRKYQKTCMGHFDPLRRPKRFNFSTVLVLRCAKTQQQKISSDLNQSKVKVTEYVYC